VEAILPKYSGLPELNCDSTDREERFGKTKFGSRWIGPQTRNDLALLEQVRDRNRDWVTLVWISEKRSPDYVCLRNDPAVSNALQRALRRGRLLADVREYLSLLDGDGKQPVDIEKPVNIEERRKLSEAQRIDRRADISEALECLRAEAHSRPVDSKLEKVLKARGYDEGPQGKKIAEIAREIDGDFNSGNKVPISLDAIRQSLKRYYQRRGIPI